MLKNIELSGFKSFSKKSTLEFQGLITAIVGPNGSGKSNVVESIRFVLGEQSIKSMRGKSGTDLIFKGSKTLPKQNRAAVTITFDNQKKIFQIPNSTGINLDFEEISITREVYTDGSNRYLINGSEVRLKDIVEMLSSVNIGSSGHHIISQGEADRILNSSIKERRIMIEDALGLKIYQYRIRESERKIDKTRENMKEAGLLRKEVAPHLNFLKKQVEKVEKAALMRTELVSLYSEYLKNEELYIQNEKSNLKNEHQVLDKNLNQAEARLKELQPVEKNGNEIESQRKLDDAQLEMQKIRQTRDELSRKLGRLEGMLELKESKFKILDNKCPVCGGKIENGESENRPIDSSELESMRENKNLISIQLDNLIRTEQDISAKISAIAREIEASKDQQREADKMQIEIRVERNELLNNLSFLKLREENLAKLEANFENEIREGYVLVGGEILNYKNFTAPSEARALEDNFDARELQEERKRIIERIKIRLEDMGIGGGGDLVKEYEETLARDQFLAREIEDLTKSILSLEELNKELKQKLESSFKEGIEKINKQFEEFFILMFDGGSASLNIVAQEKRGKAVVDEEDLDDEELALRSLGEEGDEEEKEYGIDISISLPHKKVKELQALSGGERSLTSIALLFAMSQVNPPPFLVLDETDAALDESNSRKYGDMIEKLSKYSQLIVVTHNRETMSRAGILYGITIGSDGASKLLSIKLGEAVAIAK